MGTAFILTLIAFFVVTFDKGVKIVFLIKNYTRLIKGQICTLRSFEVQASLANAFPNCILRPFFHHKGLNCTELNLNLNVLS